MRTPEQIAKDCEGDRNLHIFELEKAYRAVLAENARMREELDALRKGTGV